MVPRFWHILITKYKSTMDSQFAQHLPFFMVNLICMSKKQKKLLFSCLVHFTIVQIQPGPGLKFVSRSRQFSTSRTATGTNGSYTFHTQFHMYGTAVFFICVFRWPVYSIKPMQLSRPTYTILCAVAYVGYGFERVPARAKVVEALPLRLWFLFVLHCCITFCCATGTLGATRCSMMTKTKSTIQRG